MSSSHGMLVVAKTDTRSLILEIWSIYRKNSVLILRSVSLSLPVRLLPSESISSISMIEGAYSRASSNSIMSRCSLSPMYLEVMSDTETQKQVASLWWQTACASIVLPTPGGPYNKMLCHGLTCPYSKTKGQIVGRINVMLIISLAYSFPAMSAKLMSGFECRMHFLSEFLTSALYLDVSSVCMFRPTWKDPCDSS